MKRERHADPLSGQLVDDDTELTLADLCAVTGMPAEQLMELINEGIVEPIATDSTRWRFHGACLWRVRCAVKLRSDLGVNWAGAALAIELIEEVRVLRARLRRLEP